MYIKTESAGVGKEKTEIKITQEHPTIKKNILILKQILLPLEIQCLKYLIMVQQPLPTVAFYNSFIHDICRNKISNKVARKYQIDKLPNKVFSKFGLTSKEVAIGILLDNMKPLVTKKGDTITPVTPFIDKSGTEKIRIKEIVLRKLKIYFPSYPKILQTLETLEQWNFITRRSESIKKKASFYWILNPRFSLEFQDKFKDILNL